MGYDNKKKRGRSFRFNNSGYAYANQTRGGSRSYDRRNDCDIAPHRLYLKKPAGLEITIKVYKNAPYIILDKFKGTVMLTLLEYFDLVHANDTIMFHVDRVRKALTGRRVREIKPNFTELEKSKMRVETEKYMEDYSSDSSSELLTDDDEDATGGNDSKKLKTG